MQNYDCKQGSVSLILTFPRLKCILCFISLYNSKYRSHIVAKESTAKITGSLLFLVRGRAPGTKDSNDHNHHNGDNANRNNDDQQHATVQGRGGTSMWAVTAWRGKTGTFISVRESPKCIHSGYGHFMWTSLLIRPLLCHGCRCLMKSREPNFCTMYSS